MNKVMNIGALVLDQKLQSRVEINEPTVAEYAAAIEEGDEFPAVLVYFDGVHYYLTDGYHRYHAHKRAGKVSIACSVVNGTFRDAVFHATGVNSKHGMRRTYEDKRKAVLTLLEDFEWEGMSNNQIAKHCAVSPTFVSELRKSMGKDTGDTVKYRAPSGEIREKKKAPGRKPAAPEPELKGPEIKPEPADDHTKEAIDMLVSENEQLKDRLAVEAMDGTPEEKALARQTIDELREELRIKNIELVAIRSTRDTLQAENAQLKKQVQMLQRKLKQAGVEQ